MSTRYRYPIALSETTKQKFRSVVIRMHSGEMHRRWGICNLMTLAAESYEATGWLEHCFATWPKVNARDPAQYPIHSLQYGEVSASTQFYLAVRFGQLWDRSAEYGSLRWELLDYVNSQLDTVYTELPPLLQGRT